MLRIPKHIGIIPDGNRRWAQQHGLNKKDGYSYGLDAGLKLLKHAQSLGVQELTYYGFTADNCKRPKEQVIAFSEACAQAVEFIKQEDVSLRVIGNVNSAYFPADLKQYVMPDNNYNNRQMRINFLVNYSWEWDMKNNWASQDISRVELVVRWGGMCRLSGFLPLQTVYSDICVLPYLWPDFNEQHLNEALNWYSKQDVTMGG